MSRVVVIVLATVLAIPAGLLVASSTALAENAVDAHFAAPGSAGAGTQTAVLAIGFAADRPGVPRVGDFPSVDANRLGYTTVVWHPAPALVPATGIATTLVSVSACATSTTVDGVSPTAGCVPLTVTCPNPNLDGPAALAYCPSFDAQAQTVTIHLGLTRAWAGALRLELTVKQQPVFGVVTGSTVVLKNDVWNSPTPAVSPPFVTLPPLVSTLHVTTHPDCGVADEAQPLALTPDATQTFYAVGEDKLGNCLGLVASRWDLTADIGAIAGPNPATSATLAPGHAGAGRVSANDQAGHAAQSAPLVVTPGAATSIRVTDAQGQEVRDATLTADQSLVLAARAVDKGGNALGAVVADWTVVHGCGAIATPSAPIAIFQANTAGILGCRVRATAAGLAPGETGDITVTPGTPVSMTVRSADGAVAGPAAYTTGSLHSFQATVEDSDGNSAPAPASTAWRVVGDCGALDVATGARVSFAPSRDTGDCRVVASIVGAPDVTAPVATDHASALPDADAHGTRLAATTGEISVVRDLGAILVRSAPANGGVVYRDVTLTTDDARTLYAAAYDTDLRYRGEMADAAWTVTPGKATITGTGASVAFDPTHLGDAQIHVTVPGSPVAANATVHITPGAPVELSIVDAASKLPATLIAIPGGSVRALQANGTDADRNDGGPVAVSWAANGGCGAISPTASGATFAAGYVPRAPCNVTATLGAISTHVDVSLAAPTVDHLRVRDAAGGLGSVVAARTLTADASPTLYAAGYDAGDHYVGDQVVDWSASPAGHFALGAPLHADHVVADAKTVGTATIAATAGTLSQSTGTLTVVHGDLSQIRIEDKIDGTGTDGFAKNLRVGDARDVYAIGRDADSNLVGLLSVAWSTDCAIPLDCAGSVSPASGTFTTFRAERSGSALVQADDGNGHKNATTPLYIQALPPASIRIVRSLDGSDKGAATPADAMTADQTAVLCAVGSDDTGNDIGLVSVAWSVAPAAGSFSKANDACTTFDASVVGDAVVKATGEGAAHAPLVATHAVTILHGLLAKMTVAAPAATTAGVPLDATVTAADADGNPVTEYAGRVHVESSDPTFVAQDLVFAPTDSGTQHVPVTLQTAGAQTLKASDAARAAAAPVEGIATVAVSPGALASFNTTVVTTQTAGVAFALPVEARDAFGNVVASYVGAKHLTSACGLAIASDATTLTFAAGRASTPVSTRTASDACAIGIAENSTIPGQPVAVWPAALASVVVTDAAEAPVVDQVSQVAFSIRVALKDAFGNVLKHEPDRALTLAGAPSALTSGDSDTVVQGVVTLTGVKIDKATTTTGTTPATETVVATVESYATTGTSAVFRVHPAAFHHFYLELNATTITAGVPFTVNSSPKDAKNNTIWSFTSAPVFSSVEPLGDLITISSPSYVDGHAMAVLNTTNLIGARTIKIANPAGASAANAGSTAPPGRFTLLAAPYEKLSIAPIAAQVAGQQFTIDVTPRDHYANANSTWTGTGTLASAACVLTAGSALAFTGGTITAPAKLTKAATACTLTASAAGATVVSAPFAVAPGAIDHYALSLDPATPRAGQPVAATILGRDAFENSIVTGGASTRAITFSAAVAPDGTKASATDSNGNSVDFGAPTTVAFQDGVAHVNVVLRSANADTLGVVDSTPAAPSNGKTGSLSIVVAPGGATQLAILYADPSKDACRAQTFVRECIVASESVSGDRAPFAAKRGQSYTFYFAKTDDYDNLVGAEAGRFHDVGTGTGSPVPHDTGSDAPVLSATWRWSTATPAGASPQGAARATLEDMDEDGDGVLLPANLTVQVSQPS